MKKRGRPKTLKAKEVKEPFPMRFSAAELRAFKQAAGKQPLREWMRQTLVAATPAGAGIIAMVNEATGFTPATRGNRNTTPAVPNRSQESPSIESRS